MKRCRLAITLATLASHLLAPVVAYAAAPPTAASNNYCSAAARAADRSGDGLLVPQRAAIADSGVPAPRPRHSPHSHCPSCLGASVVAAIPPSATPFAVPQLFGLLLVVPVRAVPAVQLVLLPPLRGPPSIRL
ncbi:MAG: DUF2946 family protein [Betaproteobacteria bacterium]